MNSIIANSHGKLLRPNMARQMVEHWKQEIKNPKIPNETKQHLENNIHTLSMRLGVPSVVQGS